MEWSPRAMALTAVAAVAAGAGCPSSFVLWCTPVPQVREAEQEEVVGTRVGAWQEVRTSEVTFHQDGTAHLSWLHNNHIGMGDDRSATGSGTREVYETENTGPQVLLRMAEATGFEEQPPDSPHHRPGGSPRIPRDRSWGFGLDRGSGELRMYLFLGDGDLRDHHWFERSGQE
ncbi:hypothetical protein SUDANB121_00474 [Nocardiopsis dassonvillei]|uniref:hypothetical protein n=1 Tax=Nocardiopsis dassonvillei TaxID=2014 RepID=UPI003F55889A